MKRGPVRVIFNIAPSPQGPGSVESTAWNEEWLPNLKRFAMRSTETPGGRAGRQHGFRHSWFGPLKRTAPHHEELGTKGYPYIPFTNGLTAVSGKADISFHDFIVK